MNAVGIDASKGKSVFAIVQPAAFGRRHRVADYVAAAQTSCLRPLELSWQNPLRFRTKRLPGETKAVMEYTGTYYEPIANALHNAGVFVSVVNPLLIDDYGTIRVGKVKTDKKDAFKIANFALDRWTQLNEYIPAEDTRKTLKVLNRQYTQYNKILIMQKNNLIALLDSCFSNANTLFSSPYRESDGHEKWADFALILCCNSRT